MHFIRFAKIRNCHLIFRYNLGSGEELVSLVRVNVSDGIWHTASVHRVGRWTQLRLDSGDERNFNESFGLPGGHLEMHLSQHGLFAGGYARYPSPTLPPLVGFDFKNSKKFPKYCLTLSALYSYNCLVVIIVCKTYIVSCGFGLYSNKTTSTGII